ncbi:MAG TPA: translation initiation factor IF-2 [Patescibacteria group bacterium]|nr:translation initiation factor IF-2 [Patescibacteria group bacterium]
MARSRSGTRGRRGPRKPPRREGGYSSVSVAEPRDRSAVALPPTITVKELAELLDVNPADVIRELIKSGIFATINQLIDRDTASLVATELGYEVAEAEEATAEVAEMAAEVVAPAAKDPGLLGEDDPALLAPRPPIVTVMGHVDHGKTSLLDAIRSTTVASGERGGITQHIGASEVTKDGKKVVFLDTPGHEAFTAMRARGARVTDIAVIVVAADDGVMPQTLEAISHARAAKVPIVIALNKIDRPDADVDRVKTELAAANVVVEDYGGDVPLVPVSAKARTGLEELLEMILLVADLQELTANPGRPAVGTIIEAEMNKARGPVATVVVQTGTLRIGDVVVVGKTYGKVRALQNATGKRTQKIGPSSAAVVLGLGEVPEAGDILRVVADEKVARLLVEGARAAATSATGNSQKATLEDLFQQFKEGQAKELRIILKADVSGSLGAITHALGQIQSDEVRISVLHEGTGDITDTDILLASASNAIVVGFSTKLDPQARRTAESEKVDVRIYDIIYKLTDDIEAALKGMLEPEIVEVVEGRAEVRQIFRVGKSTVIAGSFVTDGRIVRNAGARVYRGGKVITSDRIDSLRRFRDDVREVSQGYECGIGLAGYHDLVEGDVIEAVTQQAVSRAALR